MDLSSECQKVFKNLHSWCSACKKIGRAWPHQLLPFAYASCHNSIFCCGLGQDILTFHRTAQVFVSPTWSTHLILLPVPFWLHSNGYACVNSFSVVICIYVRLNTFYLLWSVCVFVYGYFKWPACNMNMVESLSDLPFSWQSSCFWIERYTNNQRRSKKNQDSVWLKTDMVNTVCVCDKCELLIYLQCLPSW
jgi:hypothetical protein